MSELKNYKLILSGRDTGLRTVCMNACRNLGFEPCVPMDINGFGVALEYIKNTDYIYIGLDMFHPQMDDTLHKKIDLKNGPEFHYVLARRKGVPLTPTIRKFIRFLCSKQNS